MFHSLGQKKKQQNIQSEHRIFSNAEPTIYIVRENRFKHKPAFLVLFVIIITKNKTLLSISEF